MLLLVLVLVLIAFGLLVVALLTGSVLWAWVSVAVSVAAAGSLLVDWLQRRAAVKAGSRAEQAVPADRTPDVASVGRPGPASGSYGGYPGIGDIEPVTELIPVVGHGAAGRPAEELPPSVPDSETTSVMPRIEPSGSDRRPSGAVEGDTRKSEFSSPSVTSDHDHTEVRSDASLPRGASLFASGDVAAGGTGASAGDGGSGSAGSGDGVGAESAVGDGPASGDAGSAEGVATAGTTAPGDVSGTAAEEPGEAEIPESAEIPAKAEIAGNAGEDGSAAPGTRDRAVDHAADSRTGEPAAGSAGTAGVPGGSGTSTADGPPPEADHETGANGAQGRPAQAAEVLDRVTEEGEAAGRQSGPPPGTPGEPPEEPRDAAAAALVAGLPDEVVVVDEQPRYHLESCRSLPGRQVIPLPVGEAVELGFTPCGWCTPDRALAARHHIPAR